MPGRPVLCTGLPGFRFWRYNQRALMDGFLNVAVSDAFGGRSVIQL